MPSRVTVFSLLVMVVAASAIPALNLAKKNFMTPFSAPVTYLRSTIGDEELQSIRLE